MTPRRWIAVAAVLLVVSGAAAFWFKFLEPNFTHRKWSDRVDANLESLIDKRPADVPPGQWKFMIHWTRNLHGNWGVLHVWVDPDQKWQFLDELERRLQGPVTVATIDWIWDEYARITKGGRSYGEKYRPTQSPDLKHAD